MERRMIESNSQYRKGLIQAAKDNVYIVGKVYHKDGEFFGYAVKGKQDYPYLVTCDAKGLHCNCQAGQRGNYCKHRATCTQNMIEEAARKAAQVKQCVDCGKDCPFECVCAAGCGQPVCDSHYIRHCEVGCENVAQEVDRAAFEAENGRDVFDVDAHTWTAFDSVDALFESIKPEADNRDNWLPVQGNQGIHLYR